MLVEDGALAEPFAVTSALTIAPRPAPREDGSATSLAGAPASPRLLSIAAHDTFGAGSHPTTRLLLAALATRARPGARLLDAGTGSGVVALAAAALGLDATGLDRDPAAIACASANRAANGLDTAQFLVADAADFTEGRYDLVTANLFATDLLPCLPSLAACLAEGGLLVASGVLLPDVARTEAAAGRAGLVCVERAALEGWARLVFAPA